MDEKLTRVEHLPRVSTENAAAAAVEMRDWVSERTGAALTYICQTAFTIEETRGKTENVIGAAHLPIGVAGPLIIKGDNANGTFYVPMATTEGTLVATYLHGMRATAKVGGVRACVLDDMLDITPAFVVHDLAQARALVTRGQEHLERVRVSPGFKTTWRPCVQRWNPQRDTAIWWRFDRTFSAVTCYCSSSSALVTRWG